MKEYPQTQEEFDERFATEEACRDYLWRVRWPRWFQCPRCHRSAHRPAAGSSFHYCTECGHQASVTAGTLFERTHMSLTTWFRGIWRVADPKWPVNALALQRVLGLGSYRTAWTWLHKLRRVMVHLRHDRLSDRVEVHLTSLAGPGVRIPGVRTREGPLIAIAAEVKRGLIGHVRIEPIAVDGLRTFVSRAVEPCSVVITDGADVDGYTGLDGADYTHRRVRQYSRAQQVASALRTWLPDAHHGGVSGKHLSYYLDEFTFRFNHRACRSQGKLFHHLIQRAVRVKPVHYGDVVEGARQ